MLDIKYIRENKEEVVRALGKRNFDATAAITILLDKDQKRRDAILVAQEMQQKMNLASKDVAKLKQAGDKKAQEGSIQRLQGLSKDIKTANKGLQEIEDDFRDLLLRIPNIPFPDVPTGKDESDNLVISEKGAKRVFDFKPKDHVDIGEKLGILDFKTAARITGTRFALLRGAGAKLERALINLMLDTHTKRGYQEIVPPFLVNADSLLGTGQLPKFEEDLFKCRDDEYYLIPTSEVPLINMHKKDMVHEKDLPIKYTAYSPCFRREAGSYGKDTRGLIRNHQFNKIELIQIVKPCDGEKALEQLCKDAAYILELLELPYRIVSLCSGDLGFAAAKTYDIEVWMPGSGQYREISSCSICTDFQARRLGLKYKDTSGRSFLSYTLNASGLAVGRTFAAILENYQDINGNVHTPKALNPYFLGNYIDEKLT